MNRALCDVWRVLIVLRCRTCQNQRFQAGQPYFAHTMLRFHSLISNHKVAITLISSSVAYFAVVKALRWRRYKRIHRLYEPKFLAAKEGKGDPLTPEEAQIIHHEAHCYDMPLLMHYATEFALFRTYAIVRGFSTPFSDPLTVITQPTISKTLAATKQMSAGHCIAKRYTDVGFCTSSSMTLTDKIFRLRLSSVRIPLIADGVV